MGDKHHPYPQTCIQSLLHRGMVNKGIQDELFVQLVKQLTENPGEVKFSSLKILEIKGKRMEFTGLFS